MMNFVRTRLIYIVLGIIAWEITARSGFVPELLFPSLVLIGKELIKGAASGELLTVTGFSLYLIITGLLIGSLLALILSMMAVISKTFGNFIETVVAIMDPLPGIALLPLIAIWLGIGQQAIIFVIIHSILWPMILSALTGFKSVPAIYKEVGENIGLTGSRLVFSVMIPASFPFLLSGFKIGWARSWRALVAAEMIFGTTGAEGGLGWYIFEQRFFMNTSGVFAALIIIIIIGIMVEHLLFNFIERNTVKKWGMSS